VGNHGDLSNRCVWSWIQSTPCELMSLRQEPQRNREICGLEKAREAVRASVSGLVVLGCRRIAWWRHSQALGLVTFDWVGQCTATHSPYDRYFGQGRWKRSETAKKTPTGIPICIWMLRHGSVSRCKAEIGPTALAPLPLFPPHVQY
jgi:hypothetical protein